MPVSVIVLHYGSKQLTEQCLESLERFSPGVEVVVVDNVGDYGVQGRHTLYRPERNLGFAAGCNKGAELAKGDLLVFLNNDTRVREGWLDQLALTTALPYVGAAGPLLLYPDDRIQCAGVEVDFTKPPGGEAWNVTHLNDAWDPFHVTAVTGACLAVRRSVFAMVSGFDEQFWNGYEDVDLCLKLNRAGYKNYVVPQSEVVHYESKSDPEERFRRVRENVMLLRERWGQWQSSTAIATSPT